MANSPVHMANSPVHMDLRGKVERSSNYKRIKSLRDFEIIGEFYLKLAELEGDNTETEWVLPSLEYFQFMSDFVLDKNGAEKRNSGTNSIKSKASSGHWEASSVDSYSDDEVFRRTVSGNNPATIVPKAQSIFYRSLGKSKNCPLKRNSTLSDYGSMNSSNCPTENSEGGSSKHEEDLPLNPLVDSVFSSISVIGEEASTHNNSIEVHSNTVSNERKHPPLIRTDCNAFKAPVERISEVAAPFELARDFSVQKWRSFIFEQHDVQTDELLAEVLFAVFSLTGKGETCTWKVSPQPIENNGFHPTYVTLGQIKTYLQEAFQISSDKMQQIVNEVKMKQVVDVTLHLKVLEAKDLRPKTVKGGCNPYVSISVPNSCESYSTKLERETLSPKWNEEFDLSVKNIEKDVIDVKVWHVDNTQISKDIFKVKDFQSLQLAGRLLIQNVIDNSNKQEEYLLGSFQIPIKKFKERGIDSWFLLEFVTQKQKLKKPQGSVHIQVSAAKSKESHGERPSFEALLARLVYHHIKTLTNNNAEEETFQIPWSGQLSPEAVATLAQHSIILGLSGPLQHFSWWIVGSRFPSADIGWQLNLLQKVQSHMTSKAYSEKDLENLAYSFYNWVEHALYKLRHLGESFPSSSVVHAHHQFTSLLRIFVHLQSHAESKILGCSHVDLMDQVRISVNDYAKEWWINLVEDQLRGVIKLEEQLKRVAKITEKTFEFLEVVAKFYSPSLLSILKIPYFQETFLMLTTKLDACIRPPIMNIYSYLSLQEECRQEKADDNNMTQSFVFKDGSPLWILYLNLSKIYELGDHLPENVREKSAIHGYSKFFNKALLQWVDLTKQSSLFKIREAVEKENFESNFKNGHFSSSVTEVIEIFHDIQIWCKYMWPYHIKSMILLAILEDICFYGKTYADLVKSKVEKLFFDEPNSHHLTLPKQIFNGLHYIIKVRKELFSLPNYFGVIELSSKLRLSGTGGNEAAERLITSVNTLIENSSEVMEVKVFEFINMVIEKIREWLKIAVNEASEKSSHESFLENVLEPLLKSVNYMMLGCSYFQWFLTRLWEVLIEIFRAIMTQNANKRNISYFSGLLSIVEESFKFVSPSDGAGLTMEEAKTEEYLELHELLKHLCLSSEHLITKYCTKRLEEQKLYNGSENAELVVIPYFTRAGALTVKVLQAKGMKLLLESSIASTSYGHFYNQNQCSCVKVQLVPTEWFPSVREARTKTDKCDPAVFNETFTLQIGKEDSGVEDGFLVFSINFYKRGRSDILVGEALIPLKNIPCVDSGLDQEVQLHYIKTTTPGMETDYQSLKVLKLRTSDPVARAFLKVFRRRRILRETYPICKFRKIFSKK